MARADLHQHDLSPAAAAGVVATAGVGKRDAILEVGPGTGELTAALLARGARVAAIELDPVRVDALHERFADELSDGRLRLLAGDARYHHPLMPAGWRVVANPPFMHSSELLRRWLLTPLSGGAPRAIDLVWQQQAAEKITRTDDWSLLGVLAQLAAEVRISKRLPRDAVTPPSHVPLCQCSLRQRDDAPAAMILARVARLLEVAFAGAHSVEQALSKLIKRGDVRDIARIDGRWRSDAHPRTVPPQAWLSLAEALVERRLLG